MIIIIRLIVLGFFFHYRITHPVIDAYALWLTSVICEIWFALSWILDQFPKWLPVDRETYLDRLSLRSVSINYQASILILLLFLYYVNLETLISCLLGMKVKASHLSSLRSIYLWVQLIHWKNHHWWLQTQFSPFLQWTTRLIRSRAMSQTTVLPCWHSKHYQKCQNLLRNGFLSARNSTLSLGLLSHILLKNSIISEIKSWLHSSKSEDQWRWNILYSYHMILSLLLCLALAVFHSISYQFCRENMRNLKSGLML